MLSGLIGAAVICQTAIQASVRQASVGRLFIIHSQGFLKLTNM